MKPSEANDFLAQARASHKRCGCFKCTVPTVRNANPRYLLKRSQFLVARVALLTIGVSIETARKALHSLPSFAKEPHSGDIVSIGLGSMSIVRTRLKPLNWGIDETRT